MIFLITYKKPATKIMAGLLLIKKFGAEGQITNLFTLLFNSSQM